MHEHLLSIALHDTRRSLPVNDGARKYGVIHGYEHQTDP